MVLKLQNLALDVFLTMLIVTQSETASYEFTAFAVGRKCMLWNYIYVLADSASASPAPCSSFCLTRIVKLSPVAGNVASSSSASISATESAVAGAAAMSFDHPGNFAELPLACNVRYKWHCKCTKYAASDTAESTSAAAESANHSASTRSETPATSNGSVCSNHITSSSSSMATKFPNALSAFPRNLIQSSSSS
ncbi:hypothetical protein OIU77_026393 [Salix suchowensis]|uniref:Uncharacterized protein n=1 Tax=Salix suchowensis TaxID=1278906 RepID=A0ABQ9BPV8_9ROSI|nr:hypothetical protein OIU77_026393 [Salix suchowensis]